MRDALLPLKALKPFVTGKTKMTKRAIPQFLLDAVTPTGKDTPIFNRKQLHSALANWMSVYRLIKDAPNTRAGMQTVARLLYIEYHREGGPRMDIVVRLYGRFNRIRMEVERAEL